MTSREVTTPVFSYDKMKSKKVKRVQPYLDDPVFSYDKMECRGREPLQLGREHYNVQQSLQKDKTVDGGPGRGPGR